MPCVAALQLKAAVLVIFDQRFVLTSKLKKFVNCS